MSKTTQVQIVKTPYAKQSWTPIQQAEMLACMDPVDGYLYFMDNFFYIQHPTRGKIPYHPFEYQKRLIYNYHNYRFSISLMPRQTGKSTSAAGYLLWYAMFVPDSTILIAAHKYLGAQEIMQRIRFAYEACPDHIRAGVTSYNKGSIDFDNGSRIVAQTTTENTGRGMSISLLYADEFAFVRPTIASEFWTSMAPTLSTGGKAIITSTPNSDEDQFALLWKGANKCVDEEGNATEIGVNGFRAFRAYWREHPERDEKWEREQRGQLGEERFRREMDCEFIIADETLINSVTLFDLEPKEPVSKQGLVRWYQEPQPNKTYVVGLDPSIGTGGDPAAIEVYEANSTTQIAEWRHNKTTIPEQIKILADICKHIATKTDATNIYFTVENNSIGEAALISLRDYGEENIPGSFISEPGKKRRGFNTTNSSKITACAKLKQLLESKRMQVASRLLISELKTFVAAGNSYKAKLGETDDLVMATLLCIRAMDVIQSFDAEISQHWRDHEEIIQPMPFIAII